MKRHITKKPHKVKYRTQFNNHTQRLQQKIPEINSFAQNNTRPKSSSPETRIAQFKTRNNNHATRSHQKLLVGQQRNSPPQQPERLRQLLQTGLLAMLIVLIGILACLKGINNADIFPLLMTLPHMISKV